MAAIIKNGNVVGGGDGSVEFEELSYADYKAGNYDKTKSYVIPDYPYSNGKASDIEFDDTTAQLGADDVQDAIEAVNEKTVKSTVLTGTTTESGAILMPTKCFDKVIGAHYTPIDGNLKGLVFSRGDTYLTCLKLDLTPQANTEVSVKIYYE